jgi:hypothetical protein
MATYQMTDTGADIQAAIDKIQAVTNTAEKINTDLTKIETYPDPASGTSGQVPESDGNGGIAWKTVSVTESVKLVTIPSSGWVASTAHSGYYKNVVTITSISDANPTWGISDSTGTGIPTADQITAYNAIICMLADSTAKILTFYASAAQSVDIYVSVKGVA